MKKNKNKPVIRTINLKLKPTDESLNYFNEYIDFYSSLHDTAVTRYIQSGQIEPLGIKGAMTDYLNPAQKEEFRKEFRDLGCTGTFIDLAIGQRGATSFYKALLKKAKRDILFRDAKILKLESESPNLLKLRSVYYPKINDAHGECAMCGKKGEVTNKSNECEEYLCDVCFMDFRKFRKDLKFIRRRYISRFFFLCRKIAEEKEISQSLRKMLEQYSAPAPNVTLKNTVTEKAGIKKRTIKINWNNKTVSMKTHSGKIMHAEFLGEHYYSNYPQYGYMADTNKFKKLITDFINNGGYASLLRHRENGQTDFYLSIPTHYPAPQTKLPVRGYVIVSARSILLHINGKIEFLKLNRIYFKKRIFESKRAKISKFNDELLLFEWNQVGKYNRKLLKNLKNKLGFVWAEKPEVIKSEDGKTIRVSGENVTAEISLNNTGETAVLTSSNGDKRTLYAVETMSRDEKYTTLKIYLQKPVPMPRKYSEGNLLKYIKHQNQITARIIIEKIKPELPENSGVVLIDYTYLHSEGEGVVTPIASLNEQIKNMLQYEGIYAGSVPWTRLKELICPGCQNILEKAENRYIIRDILLSNINSWTCDCNYNNRINNPLIVVAKNMESNIEKLLKPLTGKEKVEGEELETEQVPLLLA